MRVDESECGTDPRAWFRSSYSAGDGGQCVEVASCPDTVQVRDSTDITRPGLALAPTAWTAFITFAREV
ncbi:DUF397 domain-containing protein [Streptomyces sp. NBC_01460]|uniref:DUF397 domain-containing protein n=1 Tax=Streptomyces sp. NBC_01460 TaxID=2903875 RepID=UPI002E36B9B9|nr:DUF397 domain-containing protein [Streptomyces sp. NBC_01460]